MPDVYSLPVSTSLLAEVNAVGAESRNKAQDGTVGDTAHEQHVSDHNRDETGNTGSSHDSDNINEVHARDVDARGPWLIKGGAERIVQLIVANVRARGYSRRRVKYVISRRRIWEWRYVNGEWQFVQRAYDGADPHDLHFHVSFQYGSGSGSSNPENDTSPWGIRAAYEQESDEVDAAQEDRIAKKAAQQVWSYMMTRPDGPDGSGNKQTSAGAYQAYSDVQASSAAGKVITALTPLISAGRIDTKALVAELVGPLTASVLAALPADRDGVISPDELKAGIVAALTDLATAK
jgi:hypothetical protein